MSGTLAENNASGLTVDLDKEILARIRASKLWDKASKVSDFQIKVAENGTVLINLKTRRAQLLYDDDSELHDWEELGFGDVTASDRRD